jgi:hypothetical protein
MSFFADFRRGYRRGRGDDFSGDGHGYEEPRGFPGDDHAACERIIAALREENESLRAQLARGRDDERGQATDQLFRAQKRELESILAFPGVRVALVKALHPDTGSGGSTASRTEIFQTLMAVMERLGIRG